MPSYNWFDLKSNWVRIQEVFGNLLGCGRRISILKVLAARHGTQFNNGCFDMHQEDNALPAASVPTFRPRASKYVTTRASSSHYAAVELLEALERFCIR